MKITYFKGKEPNFGDDLNPWLWPKLIPNFFDDDEKTVFLGIGSIIGEKSFKDDVRKVVFGAGFVPEYHTCPNVDSSWNIYFVRGPRTAKMLDIPNSLGLGDSAILLRTVLKPLLGPSSQEVSFIPHWESLRRGNWVESCRLANINLIDPRLPVETVLEKLKHSRTVITESMHGAIIADALRIPWVPLLPLNKAHRTKWLDWADSMELKLQPYRLWPSSLQEARLSVMRKIVTKSPVAGLIQQALTYLAAHRLTQLASAAPQLSADHVIDRVTDAMLDKVEQLKRNFR